MQGAPFKEGPPSPAVGSKPRDYDCFPNTVGPRAGKGLHLPHSPCDNAPITLGPGVISTEHQTLLKDA